MADTNNEILEFVGKVENIRFYSEASAWGAIVVSVKDDVPHSKLSYDYDIETNMTIPIYSVTVAGKMPEPMIGNSYIIVGKHVYVAKYKSDQYEVVSMSSDAPKTVEDQRGFLLSLCTENQVEAMLSVYPDIIDQVINGNDSNIDLGLLKGIGQVTWDKIKEKIVENFAIADVLSLLVPIGISFKKIQKLLDNESNPQILKAKLLKNPYVITSISGISFKVADKIATELNPGLKESEQRLIAFVRHYLTELADGEGDTWIKVDELRSEVIKNVPEVEKFLDSVLEREKTTPKLLFIENEKIGLKYQHDMEVSIFKFMNELSETEPLQISQENIEKGIAFAEQEQGFSFSEQQKNTLLEMVKSNFNILSGFGGSGKSSLARGLLNIYKDAGYEIAVCALSAKAAKRCSETTGANGTTIHRLLEADREGFGRNTHNKLSQSLMLVDESSMCNNYVLNALFSAIDITHSKVILMGDHHQLPPIQSGQVFADIVTTENKYQKNVLTEVFRQAKNSGIFIDAMNIRKGIDPVEQKEAKIVHGEDSSMIYIFSSDKEKLHSIAIASYEKAVKEDGIENVVLLSPRKQKVLNSTNQFNIEIQQLLNSENMNGEFFEHGKKKILKNDRVIQTVNDKDKNVYNGFVGRVSTASKNGFSVDFDDGSKASYTREDCNDIDLAHSLSVHRVQGSEYSSVIIVLDMNSYMLLCSEILYTAATRGQKRVLLLAEPNAYDMCLRESKNKRKTWLKGMLENGE